MAVSAAAFNLSATLRGAAARGRRRSRCLVFAELISVNHGPFWLMPRAPPYSN